MEHHIIGETVHICFAHVEKPRHHDEVGRAADWKKFGDPLYGAETNTLKDGHATPSGRQ